MGHLASFKVGNETYIPSNIAAHKVGVSSWTIRHSRSTGMLLGTPAPSFIRRGVNIFYKESDIDAFLAEAISSEFSTTADYAGLK
jgi:hypothetical protein